MRFRRIYWVTEQFEEGGDSRVVGVYTSIPDLIEIGLPLIKGKAAGFRVSLYELDSDAPAIASFSSDDLSGVGAAMHPLVTGGEFTHEEAKALEDSLGG